MVGLSCLHIQLCPNPSSSRGMPATPSWCFLLCISSVVDLGEQDLGFVLFFPSAVSSPPSLCHTCHTLPLIRWDGSGWSQGSGTHILPLGHWSKNTERACQFVVKMARLKKVLRRQKIGKSRRNSWGGARGKWNPYLAGSSSEREPGRPQRNKVSSAQATTSSSAALVLSPPMSTSFARIHWESV